MKVDHLLWGITFIEKLNTLPDIYVHMVIRIYICILYVMYVIDSRSDMYLCSSVCPYLQIVMLNMQHLDTSIVNRNT